MDPKRWEQIDKLLDEALEREPAKRGTFLAQACGDDEQLREVVEELIAAHEQAGSFGERPAVEVAARLMTEEPGRSLAGKTLGPHEILSLIGRGGMGEVYRARDTRLDRIDALKILPVEVASDPERIRRFVREAKAASALNHPNIATIYEIGESEGIHWISMELVEGETLAQRLNERSLGTTEILDIGIQVCEALEKAHNKGIVHRDIKPANIMLTPEGQVKVLDFGLAKVTRPEGQAATGTVTTESHTIPGMVMGTARYMSPEQVLGQAADHRTDIFSLGAVLYEMATGRPPFTGDTASAIFDAIVHEKPAWPSKVQATIPEDLRRIIQKSLEKFREMRYQSAADLCGDLKRLKNRDAQGEAAGTKAGGGSWRWTTAAILVLCVVGSGIFWYANRQPASPHMEVLNAVPLTTYPGIEDEPALSPDGSQVAFKWYGERGDNADIYVKLIGFEPPRRFTTDPAEDYSPAWSPDNRWIAYCRDLPGGRMGIFLIPSVGGPERLLTEAMHPGVVVFAPYLAWSPDSRRLIMVCRENADERPALFLLDIESHQKRRLTKPPAGGDGDGYPALSPDGQVLAFCRWAAFGNADLYLLDLPEGNKLLNEPRRITTDNWREAIPTWTLGGRTIVFSGWKDPESKLWRIGLSDADTATRLVTSSQFSRTPAISRRGDRLAYAQWVRVSNIWRLQVPSSFTKALAATRLIPSTSVESLPAFSPDGKKVLFASYRSGSSELWLCNSDGSDQVQLTSFGKGSIAYSIPWSSDSTRMTFSWDGEGHKEVYVISASGGTPERLTTTAADMPQGSGDPSWSWDGQWIYFDVAEKDGHGCQICKIPASGGPAVKVIHIDGYAPIESPDGRFLYYFGGTPGFFSVFRIPLEGGKAQHLFDSPVDCYWPVGDGIYFIPKPERAQDYSISLLNTTTRVVKRIASFDHPVTSLTVSPDRRWILYTQDEQFNSDLMLVENFR